MIVICLSVGVACASPTWHRQAALCAIVYLRVGTQVVLLSVAPVWPGDMQLIGWLAECQQWFLFLWGDEQCRCRCRGWPACTAVLWLQAVAVNGS
jgi:hypothetical protein